MGKVGTRDFSLHSNINQNKKKKKKRRKRREEEEEEEEEEEGEEKEEEEEEEEKKEEEEEENKKKKKKKKKKEEKKKKKKNQLAPHGDNTDKQQTTLKHLSKTQPRLWLFESYYILMQTKHTCTRNQHTVIR